ncbi:MAG: hypothetical protein QM589_02525 [Thermomicrobiales bacterium]
MENAYPTERWPAGHRAALLVVVNLAAAEDGNPAIPIRGLDYAATGFQHLLQTLADLDVAATTAWSEQALATSPQLARRALDEGHDVIPASGAAAGRDLITRLTGEAPAGAMTAGDSDPGNLAWTITDRGGDLPVLVGEGVVSIPTSPFWTDATWFDPDRPSPPSALLETWSQGLQSVRASGQLMTVVLHPHLCGRPGFLEAISRFLDEAIGAGDVWIPRGSELAAWWLSRIPRTVER